MRKGVARIPLGLKPSRDSRATSQRDSPIWIQPLGVFRYNIRRDLVSCDLQKYCNVILSLCPANERWRYFVTTSFIAWAQADKQPCDGYGLSRIERLTHWGQVTHICVGNLTIIGPDNGLSPGWHQAIIWTNAGILLIQTLGTNFSEILREIYTFPFKKMHLKMSYGKFRPSFLGLNVLSFEYVVAHLDWDVSRITYVWHLWTWIKELQP